MTRHARNGLLLAVALLAACGQGAGRTTQGGGAAPTTPAKPTTTTPTTPATPATPAASPVLTPEPAATASRAFIRLLGTDNPGYDALLADVAHVSVEVNGAAVALDYSGVQRMDLTNATQAWRVASFAMPPAGSTVHVTVALDEPAIWERAGASGDLDTCGKAIEFTAPAEWFALRGHAVIVLDLGRSITGPAATPVLLPNLQVMY
ncbi:MAG TPA: hypothetical protein VFM45_08530 [Anaeromyxobacteraceae bacterium]|nr:hypothetical protein [Anaeromyxobacteraceae bacterium]